MEEFDSFIATFLSRNGKPLICGDFNYRYWVDDPAHNPYSSEFMDLLNTNNFKNVVWKPTHAFGHTLDLVSFPGDFNVDNLKVHPINSNISDHDMVFFHVNFPKTYSFTKYLTFKIYQRVADASHFMVLNEL